MKCPRCEANVRINRDGTIRVHRRPRPTSWARGKQPVCGASRWTPAHLRDFEKQEHAR